MRALVRLALHNSVAVHLATLAVCVGGVLAYTTMPREVFPSFSLDTVLVQTFWPGAAPEDVERLLTLPIEEELEGVDGLDEMSSISREGLSQLTLSVRRDRPMPDFLDDVRAALARDLELPDEVEDPRVIEVVSEWPAIAVFLYGNSSEVELRALAERHRRALEKIPGVSDVEQAGVRDPRLWVEVDPLALERFGLSLQEVGQALSTRVRDVPAGSLSASSGDYLLRVDAEVDGADDLRELPLRSSPSGASVRLGQVARIDDGFERWVTLARFNEEPCIRLQVNKREDADAIEISRAVYAYIERESERMPPGTALGTNSDLSIYVRNRLNVMQSSAALGAVLVLVSLVLFLNVRVALVTAVGIPVAFLGGLMIAGMAGLSMNMITMFALIVVLGMLVDDAIVVAENIYRRMEEGQTPMQAAIEGTAEVGKPVLATILTTIAAFLPILMLRGTTGMFLRPLPLIVTFCLLASLLEAMCALPVHMARWTGRGAEPATQALREPERRWYDGMRDLYVGLLRVAVRWRWVTLGLTLVVASLCAGVASYRLPFMLFDDFESKVFYVNVRAPADSSLEETELLTQSVKRVIDELPREEIESTNSLVGVAFIDATQFDIAQHLAQIWVELREDSTGRRPTSAIIAELRERLALPPPGIESIDIDQPQAGPTGKAIDISLRGPELARLGEHAAVLEARLASFAGVREVRNNAEEGKRELRVVLKQSGRVLGFDEARLGAELRTAFEGVRYGRLRRGRDDVEIHVKLPEALRSERGVLERLRVTAPDGRRLPLAAIAEVHEGTGPASITRDDGERSVRVLADVDRSQGNAQEITTSLVREYADFSLRHPGYSIQFEGDFEDTSESIGGLVNAGLLAAMIIYLVLGTLFRSASQPLVIMLAMPFSLIGMVAGHLIMERPISLMSLIGLMALCGVVVNDSLILVDFVNQRRARGVALVSALVDSGRLRFRPILLTSITTMLGLSPLTFFASGQARFLQPMAITIFFGLAFSTILILVVIPCAYGALIDLHSFLAHPWRSLRALVLDRPMHATAQEGVRS